MPCTVKKAPPLWNELLLSVHVDETRQIPVVHKIKLNNLNEKLLRGFVTYIVSDEADFFVGEV
jgi:hypothetical protein